MTGWTALVAAHAVTASVGLLLGGYQLWRRVKGDRTHRILGWIWVTGMLFVTSSSFAIRNLRNGQLSFLHVLSLVTLISLTGGVLSIRRGDVSRHRAWMRGSWFGLVGAFVGAVAVPARLIPTFALTDPAGALLAAGAIVSVTAALIVLAHLLGGRGTRPCSCAARGRSVSFVAVAVVVAAASSARRGRFRRPG